MIEPKLARALIHDAQARDRRMTAALANVRRNQTVRAARRLARRYASARLAAVSRAWQARKCSIKDCTDKDVLAIVSMAKSLFAWKTAPEKALAWPKLKRDGESYRNLGREPINGIPSPAEF